MQEIALKAGALGAKLTGTGRGGLLIALTPGKELQEKVAEALEKEGFECQKTSIGLESAGSKGTGKTATCEATANIAVIKYWGKRDEKLILPKNSSLSFTMDGQLKTRTTVMFSQELKEDEFWLNNKKMDLTDKETAERLQQLDVIRQKAGIQDRALIVSLNCFPTAAGFASSAAGLAALAWAASKAAGLSLSGIELSVLARLGSGSASRSVLGGFVEWQKGEKTDGSDSVAVQIAPATHWPELRNVIVVVDAGKKKISSRAGMKQTVATSPLYPARLGYVDRAIEDMKRAVLAKDFQRFAELVMRESNSLHSVMLDTWPPISYLNDISKEIIYAVHDLNAAEGKNIAAYTFDAGPNAHIYTTEENVPKVRKMLEGIKGVAKIMVCRVGEGPKFLENEQEALIDLETGKPRKATFDEKTGQIDVETGKKIKVRAPGKLMLSGEWSVLEVGIPCIVMSIDQKVGAEIKEAETIGLSAPDIGVESIGAGFYGKSLSWSRVPYAKEAEKLMVPKNAIELTLKYLQNRGVQAKNFNIRTFSSETIASLPDGTKAKVGFGSSAAVCVAIVSAILRLHGYNLKQKKEKDLVFKIACTAHYLAQGKVGSSFDIAASTYGGVLVYRRFDPGWLVKEMGSGKPVAEIMDSEWPSFFAENIELPGNMQVLAGFVGYSASTKELILKLNSFKTSQKEQYWRIINSIKEITEKLIGAIKEGSKTVDILELVRSNRKCLKELSDSSQNNLETKELSTLIDVANSAGGAGKFSGAGGGDCGIAVCFDTETAEKIRQGWKQSGIVPIDIRISKKGAG